MYSDSEVGYDQVMGEIAQTYGTEYTTDVKIKILGTPEHDTCRIAVTEMKLPITPEEFLEIYKAKVKVVLTNPPLMPGTRVSPNLFSN